MDSYIQNLCEVLVREFNGDVIPIALVKDQKQPLYSHANITNEALWKKWENQGYKEVMTEQADMGLVIRNRAMVVIDFDDKDTSHIFEEKCPSFKDTVKQSTKKGFHYFFKGSALTKEMKLSNQVRPFGEDMDIDIITTWDKGTGGVITVYPSANKEWIRNIIDTPIKEVPEKFIQLYKDKALKDTTTKKKKTVEKTKSSTQDSQGETCDFETLKKVVVGLSADRAVAFDTWHRVVWAIFNYCCHHDITDNKRDRLIHLFSQKAIDKYDKDRVDEFINDHCNFNPNGYSMGTLVMYLNEDNPELYRLLFSKIRPYIEVRKIFETNRFKVLNPPMFCTIDTDGKITMQTRVKFKETWEHIKCLAKNGLGQLVETCFVDIWFKDANIRHYKKIDFLPPPLSCPNDVFNTWRGFAIENENIESSGDVQPFLDHVDVMTNHDNKTARYFIKWLAQLVQYPGVLSETAIVLYGVQGVGKNIVFEMIGEMLGHHKHGTENALFYDTAKPDRDLFGKHSVGRRNKILVCINEAKGKDTYGNMNELKDAITSTTMIVEPKGIDGFSMRNFNRFVFTTNNKNSVPIEEGDRRYVLIVCSKEKKGLKQYFTNFKKYSDDLANQKAVFEYLKGIDLNGFDFENERPISKLYKQIQGLNIPNYIHFFIYFIENWNDDKVFKYTSTEFFQAYLEFLKAGNYETDKMTHKKFNMLLEDMMYDENENPNGFILPGKSKGSATKSFNNQQCKEWLIREGYCQETKCLFKEVDDCV